MAAIHTSDHALRLDRRHFLTSAAAGLVVGFTVDIAPASARATNVAPGSTPNLGAFIRIALDGTITVYIGATEMGQGIMTGMAQLVAEELMVPWATIRAVHAPADAAYNNALFHIQATGGSTSMRAWYAGLRDAASVARQQLIIAGAARLGRPASACSAGHGTVYVTADPTQSVAYAAIVADAANVPPPAPSRVTSLKVIGQRLPRTDIPAKVDGSAVFGIDVQLPGMVYASVLHCPTLGGTVGTMPAKPAGALAVVNLGSAVGVVANDTWSAMTMARGLRVGWSIPAASTEIDTAKIFASARALAVSTTVKPQVPETSGNAAAAFAAAKVQIDQTYELPYLAHACMEVLNCTVSITPGVNGGAATCDIWAPTQGQSLCVWTAQGILGQATRVNVHTTYLGGGLGRKFEQDFISQAILIARAVGRPVKLVWSRTEDFRNDKYRPCAVIRVRAGFDAAGNVAALLYRNVSPSIALQNNVQPGTTPEDPGATSGATGLPYAIATRRIEYVPLPAGVPIGYWRSVGESYNVFAVESAVDELAKAGGLEPIALRRKLLAGQPGLAVLNAAVAMAAKASPRAKSARGVAFMSGFGSLIAMIVEITLDSSGKIRVTQVFCAIDCGTVVNPDSVEAQMQGGIAHGISATLWGQVTFKAGVANVTNFSNYRLMRLGEMPSIQVQTVQTGAITIGGVGETGVPCVAPAIANAYAHLTGKRTFALPFYPGATMSEG